MSRFLRLGPEMITIGHVDELGRDPKFVAGFTHTAFQHRVDVQLLADFAAKTSSSFLPLNAKDELRPGTCRFLLSSGR